MIFLFVQFSNLLAAWNIQILNLSLRRWTQDLLTCLTNLWPMPLLVFLTQNSN